jgi:hypothetical protein
VSSVGTASEALLQRCRSEPWVRDGVVPELCPGLAQIILQRQQRDRSTKSLNVGGWKSTEDFFMWPEAPVQALLQAVLAETGRVRLTSWAMVNRAGSHHPRHQHRAARLTGVFYVAGGSADAIVPTIYECEVPLEQGRRGSYEIEVEPHPGRLVICRGEMWHRLPVYAGAEPRIAIVFDVAR